MSPSRAYARAPRFRSLAGAEVGDAWTAIEVVDPGEGLQAEIIAVSAARTTGIETARLIRRRPRFRSGSCESGRTFCVAMRIPPDRPKPAREACDGGLERSLRAAGHRFLPRRMSTHL